MIDSLENNISYRQANRQTDRKVDRQTDRQTMFEIGLIIHEHVYIMIL